MKSILEEMEEIGADGVDFISIDSYISFTKEKTEFKGTIYESYTIEELKNATTYPRTVRLFWKGTKDDKHYINMIHCVQMKFGNALDELLKGSKLTRQNWNGKNQFIYYVPQGSYKPCTKITEQLVNEQGLVDYAPYIALKTVQGQVVPWTPSVSDVLAEDWMVV